MKNLWKILPLLFLTGCPGPGTPGNPGSDTLSKNYSWLVPGSTDPVLSSPSVRVAGPEDWRDEIIYFVMTDRFFDGDSGNNTPYYDRTKPNYYHGGDLAGIATKSDYIRKLGMTTVWITPVVKNAWEDAGWTSYHGYYGQDFTQVDPHLAKDNTAYQTFVTDMHNQGLLVIQDIVVNHTANNLKYTTGNNSGWNPVFQDDPSPLTRVFVEDAFPGQSWITTGNRIKPVPFNDLAHYHNNGSLTGSDYSPGSLKGDLSGLDDLKTEDPTVRTLLGIVYKNWLTSGVDGYRIDTVKHLEEDFWDTFVPDVLSSDSLGSKKFLMFGEALIGSHSGTARYTKSTSENARLDSMLNFELYYRIRDVFRNGGATNLLTQELNNRDALLRSSINTTDANSGGVSAADGAINFIDNHDNPRFLSEVGATQYNYWLSLMYIMTTKGIPSIYYNSENNIKGTTDSGRADMPDFTTTGKQTFTLIRTMAKIRTENIALRRGNLSVLADSSTSGIFSFLRSNGTTAQDILVILNTSSQSISTSITVSPSWAESSVAENILYKEFGIAHEVSVASGNISTEIPPMEMKIFKLKP